MTRTQGWTVGLAWLGLAVAGGVAPAMAQDGQALLQERCASCHQPQSDGTLSRIGDMRKTPEGWLMTLFRMRQLHGVEMTPEETQTLVRWLSDRQGLAPEESAPYRYILERQPAVIEEPVTEADLSTMCARCHSFARTGLQRRDTEEWRKLAHFHLGQWPTIEYQALGRDRKWWELASTVVSEQLGTMFPLQTQEWEDWQKAPKPDLSGTWIATGHWPGDGPFGGTVTISKAEDGYTVEYDLTDAAGRALKGSGTSVVYTGYEWRGTATIDGRDIREVAAASKDGRRLSGRVFLAEHDEIGASFEAVKAVPDSPVIAGFSQPHLRTGETARMTIWGNGLDGEVDLGPGVTAEVVSRGPNALVVEATAAADAAPGQRTLAVGSLEGAGPVVYSRIDSVRVEPDYAIARVGGNGGPLPPVAAQFEAVGYLNGADGQPGTEDDVRIGAFPATWTLEPYNETAEVMQDVKFAGQIDSEGLFTPAGAGPNPDRQFSTNNVGDLKVVATVRDGDNSVVGEGRLINTVQRWNDPPIR